MRPWFLLHYSSLSRLVHLRSDVIICPCPENHFHLDRTTLIRPDFSEGCQKRFAKQMARKKLMKHRVHPQYVRIRPSPVLSPSACTKILQEKQTHLGVERIVRENEKARPCQALGHFHAGLVCLNASCRDCKRWRVIPSIWLCRDCCITGATN